MYPTIDIYKQKDWSLYDDSGNSFQSQSILFF